MNTREVIKKYKITLVPNSEDDLIKVSNVKDLKADNMVGFVKDHKKEIVHELKALKGEFIPGLKEIKKAKAEWNNWKKDFNASFESEDATPLPKRPDSDLNDLLKKYPQAKAYLQMEALSNSADYELSSIGDVALEMVVDGDWEGAIKYDREKEREFVNEHLWD
ncbi:hypothetical protein HCY90_00615 [Limosilactobacillus fermentum]